MAPSTAQNEESQPMLTFIRQPSGLARTKPPVLSRCSSDLPDHTLHKHSPPQLSKRRDLQRGGSFIFPLPTLAGPCIPPTGGSSPDLLGTGGTKRKSPPAACTVTLASVTSVSHPSPFPCAAGPSAVPVAAPVLEIPSPATQGHTPPEDLLHDSARSFVTSTKSVVGMRRKHSQVSISPPTQGITNKPSKKAKIGISLETNIPSSSPPSQITSTTTIAPKSTSPPSLSHDIQSSRPQTRAKTRSLSAKASQAQAEVRKHRKTKAISKRASKSKKAGKAKAVQKPVSTEADEDEWDDEVDDEDDSHGDMEEIPIPPFVPQSPFEFEMDLELDDTAPQPSTSTPDEPYDNVAAFSEDFQDCWAMLSKKTQGPQRRAILKLSLKSGPSQALALFLLKKANRETPTAPRSSPYIKGLLQDAAFENHLLQQYPGQPLPGPPKRPTHQMHRPSRSSPLHHLAFELANDGEILFYDEAWELETVIDQQDEEEKEMLIRSGEETKGISMQQSKEIDALAHDDDDGYESEEEMVRKRITSR